MSLNGCLEYLLGQLQGLTSADLPAATAYITPRRDTVASLPAIYLWCRKPKEKLIAMGGVHGPRRGDYPIDIWLLNQMDPSSATRDQQFQILIDAVLAKLAGLKASIPIPITDPTTGAQSYLMDVADEFTTDIDITRGNRRMLLSRAHISAPVMEYFSR